MSRRCWQIPLLCGVLWSCQALNPHGVRLVDGVYWSGLYQAYLEVENQTAVRYQWTPEACQAGAAGLIPLAIAANRPAGQHRWLDADHHRLVLQRYSDGLPVVFERVESLPASCKSELVQTAELNLEVLRSNLEQFHHRLDAEQYTRLDELAEGLNTEYFDSELITTLALFGILSSALSSSDDEHAFLIARDLQRYHRASNFELDEAEREAARQEFMEALANSAMQSECRGALWHGRLNTKEYYLASLRLHSFTETGTYDPRARNCLRKALHNVERGLQDHVIATGRKPYLVVDLRYNEGGSLLLASQFAHSIKFNNLPLAYIGKQPISVRRTPNLDGLYQGGRVLVTEITASAAEHLAQALKLRGFKLAGQNTRGAFSPTTVRTLPNGWILGLSMYAPEVVKDGSGKLLPAKVGLSPDCFLPVEESHEILPEIRCRH